MPTWSPGLPDWLSSLGFKLGSSLLQKPEQVLRVLRWTGIGRVPLELLPAERQTHSQLMDSLFENVFLLPTGLCVLPLVGSIDIILM